MKEGQNGGGRASTQVEFITGTTAGALSSVVGHPFDIVKTRMQIHESKPSLSVKPLTSINVIRGLYKAQPFPTGFYRGITSSVIGSSTSWGLFFGFKALAEKLTLSVMTTAATPSTPSSQTEAKLQTHHFFISSTVAGIATQVLTNPLWVVKTRMMSTDRAAPNAYPTTKAAFKGIWREGGVKLLYSGCLTSFAGVFQGSLQFSIYDTMKQAYMEHQSATYVGDGDKVPVKMGDWATFGISTTAKVVSTVMLYPYQVVRSRLQTHDGSARFGKGIREVCKRLWQEAGLRGFYKGLVPGVARTMPATWVTFLVYENLKPYLMHHEAEKSG